MAKTYSTYEAKARLSEVLDQVRKGQVVTITRRGVPIAEVRPVDRGEVSLPDRLDAFRRKGIISEPAGSGALKVLARRRGALNRFLDSRE